MKPGQELDALIAEKVMGLKVNYEFYTCSDLCDNYDEMGYIPAYSTDIASAWEVVEKLLKLHSVEFSYVHFNSEWNVDIDDKIYVAADTAPHAICLAALKAVGVGI